MSFYKNTKFNRGDVPKITSSFNDGTRGPPQPLLPSISFDDKYVNPIVKSDTLEEDDRFSFVGNDNLSEVMDDSDVRLQVIEYDSSKLPDPRYILSRGYILSRISIRTLITRNWQQSYFVQYGPAIIFIFRSMADYEDWLINPYHTPRERDFLVKLRIDFMPSAFDESFKKPDNIFGSSRSHNTAQKRSVNSPLPGVLGHRVTQVTYKTYRSMRLGGANSSFFSRFFKSTMATGTSGNAMVSSLVGSPSTSPTSREGSTPGLGSEIGIRGMNKNVPMMYQFKLVRIMGQGPSPVIVAAFGSPLKKELDTFRECACSCIRFANNHNSRSAGARQGRHQVKGNGNVNRNNTSRSQRAIPNFVEFSRMTSGQRKDMIAFDRGYGVDEPYNGKEDFIPRPASNSMRRMRSDILT